jgi:hypothetical protein
LTDGALIMNTNGFAKDNQLYEILMEVRKNTRMSSAALQILITKGSPPIMEIK